jgi:hypothetical protein
MVERDEWGCTRFAVLDFRKVEVIAVEGTLVVERTSTRRRKLFLSSPGCGGEGPTSVRRTQAALGLSLRVRVKRKNSDIVANDAVSFCVVKVNDDGEVRSALSHR